jgi:3-oxoadipate enol-lactonase
VTLAHRIDGQTSGPTLVLASSLGTTWELWDAQLSALAQDFRVVRFDHPGHGRSPIPDAPVTVESLADGVVELLDALELERVSFCGLSLGGMVGMALGVRAPERLDRLVLCCTAAYLGPPEGWYERARRVRARGTSAIAEAVVGRWFTERFRDESPATVARFREMLEAIPAEGYADCCQAIARWDARSDVSTIRAATLVISGADDVATPVEDGTFLAESIPGAELTVLPECAHLANVEQPTLFARTLLHHLRAPAGREAT